MRRFWSYGPIDTGEHYYAPREELVKTAFSRLTGDTAGKNGPQKSGHYITIWAPRQSGKTWLMIEIYQRLLKDERFHVVPISLESLKDEKNTAAVMDDIAKRIGEKLEKNIDGINSQRKFQEIFKKENLDKPLILILDEFDALEEEAISTLVSAFRNIYIERGYEKNKTPMEKSYLLHAVALIGVRNVLGIENEKGSPFNIQHSLQVTNLDYREVKEMFKWYEKDNGQMVNEDVIRQLFYETRGQPGLIGWFGELLTETYNKHKTKPITRETFDIVYAAGNILPNNNILNIISKAKKEPYKETVLELFKTGSKIQFTYRDPRLNFLYMNGVIDKEHTGPTEYWVRFSSPFVQRCLFDYFSTEIFRQMGRLFEPFIDLDNIVTETILHIRNLAKLYESYLAENSGWLLEDVPRRKDLRIYEAVFHFNFYSYLTEFLKPWNGRVVPEFPTGNGKIDLLVTHGGKRYGVELKSFTSEREYAESLKQAAKYGKQLRLPEIHLIFFIEKIDPKGRKKYENDYNDLDTGVIVKPLFIVTPG